MLIQFNFKNFKSFRDEATLDLSAAKMTEFSNRVISVGSEKILPVAAIYGANASGKSNVYGAFEYMSEYVVNSFKYGDEEKDFDDIRPVPFLFDVSSETAETSFEVYFTVPGDKTKKCYNYGFCIGKTGVTEEWLNYKAKTARKYSTIFYRDEEDFDDVRPLPFLFDVSSETADTSFEVYFTVPGDKTEKCYNYGFCIGQTGVTEEWLNYKAKTARKYSTIFYRDEETLDLAGIPKTSRENIEIALEKEVLIVSLGAKLKVTKCKLVRDWFLNNEFADFGDAVTNFFMSRVLPAGFIDDEKIRANVVKYFSSFDETIKGFEVTKLPAQEDSKEEKYLIDALHKKIGSEDMAKIPLAHESAGTLKMFALYPELQDVLQNGGVFFIDELNARLHPLLVRNFILTFLNPEINVNHAQLVFTTHDTWQLSNQLLRRDEIWFTEKDDMGLSTLYSLADFIDEDGSRIRKDESYEKNYLLGNYGAIPVLKNIDFFKEC